MTCVAHAQAVMMMVPEAWQNDRTMPANKKAFYRWSAFAMEPWDGPGAHHNYARKMTHCYVALIAFNIKSIIRMRALTVNSAYNRASALLTFSDGRYIGAILDRNGLRPSRFYVTDDNIMYMASEVGVVDVEQSKVVQKVNELTYL